MSDTLLESELFGHERGAFTGAVHVHRGTFETAHTGPLFLDEIADMSPLAQAKILGAVEYGEFERVGGERLHRSDVRIISATNCSLRERIAAGKFREDLYHRLDFGPRWHDTLWRFERERSTDQASIRPDSCRENVSGSSNPARRSHTPKKTRRPAAEWCLVPIRKNPQQNEL
jgi:Nif-specific regulatory protein